MPLMVECHTVPHLKTLTRGIEHASRCGHDSSFTLQKTSLKSTHFASLRGHSPVLFNSIFGYSKKMSHKFEIEICLLLQNICSKKKN